jgi:hypothetical protein
MIDHQIHRFPALGFKMRDGGEDQRKSARPAGLRHGDQAGMNWLLAQQPFEVADIFRDDHAVFRDAIIFHRVIELPAPSDVQRMDGVMAEAREIESEIWREAPVDERPHPSGCSRRRFRGSSRQRVGLGEDDRRLEGFSRQIGVLGCDVL